jgi:diguanylate cyclase (GGDEF)-like protein
MLSKTAIGHGLILATGLGLALAVKVNATHELANAQAHYVQASHAETTAAARTVELALRTIYENTRTLTFIPSVRKIDRHATNLDAEGREAIQQLYNNLASGISVSEVYVVPVDIDPFRIDPVTGKGEEPIIMFDQLIVAAGRFAGELNPFAAEAGTKYAPDVPEEEIYEYVQFQEQMAWLSAHYPDIGSFDGLKAPMISGPEVITCDNTEYVLTRLDADRMGVLFSVPFFGLDGKLRGAVSAIIRSNALRALLPSPNYALVNTTYGYATRASEPGQARVSADPVAAGKPDPNLIYSEAVPLAGNDPRSQWALWAGLPDSVFFNGAEARAARAVEFGGYTVAALLTIALIVCWALVRRNLLLVQSAGHRLEQRVAERTAEIAHMATHDVLTGLPNRTMLREKMRDALARVRRGEKIAVLCLDLDHFKSVNDTLGHSTGDALLRVVTARLNAMVREIDTVARLGGDEFVVLQTTLRSPQEAGALAERIIADLSRPIEAESHQVVVGVSVGIAVAPQDGDDAEALLRNADIALYRAKVDGRGMARFFEPEMDARLQKRRHLEVALRGAIGAEQFVLHYQPILDLATQRITGFEALLRWKHPEHGLLGPEEFMSVAEETGLIVPIGEWVLHQACTDAAAWPEDLKIAINLSAVQFKNPTLVHSVVRALDQAGLAPSRVEIEITESVLLASNDTTLSTLHHFRDLGITIAMDDFGTGYSSLSYLRSFPFDKIKIDRSFVQDMAGTAESSAIVRAVAALGASLGLTTTAEGVETKEQLESVRRQGCLEVQGYYFSEPIDNANVLAMLSGDYEQNDGMTSATAEAARRGLAVALNELRMWTRSTAA